MDDALRAYEWFLEQGCSPAHVFTAGDSAGGGLCTTVLLAIRDKGLPLPAAAMPMSPWYDMGALGGTLETNADVDLLVRRSDLIETAKASWVVGRRETHWRTRSTQTSPVFRRCAYRSVATKLCSMTPHGSNNRRPLQAWT